MLLLPFAVNVVLRRRLRCFGAALTGLAAMYGVPCCCGCGEKLESLGNVADKQYNCTKNKPLMKTVHLCAAAIALLAPLTLTAEPSPEPWLWPVSGQSAGEGLLYVPQQYIGDELVFNELFIGVAPAP